MKKPSFWNELEPQQRGLLTGIILVAIVVLCIAGTKISRLTQTRTIQGDSLFVVVTGATEKATRAIEATNLITELAQFPAWTNSITGIAGAGGGLQSSNVSTNTLIYDTKIRARSHEPGFEVWANFDQEVPMGSGIAGLTSSGHQWRPAGDTNAMVISGGKFYIGAATNSAIYLSVTNIQDAVPLGKSWSKIGGKIEFINQGGSSGYADVLSVILSDTTLENGLSGNFLHVVISRLGITVQRNLGTIILQETWSLDPSAVPGKVFDFDLTIASNNVFVTCGPNKFVAYASDLNTYAIKPVVTWECFGSTTNQFVGAWHSAYAGYADASTLADDGRNGALGTNGYRFPLYNHLTANRVLMADAGKRLTNVVSSDPSNEYVKADGTTGVPAAGITTNGNQFLGVPLAIKDSATVTNLQLVGNTIAGTGQSITSHQFTNNGVGVFEHSMQINGRIIPNIQKLVSASIPIGNSSGPNYSIATNDSVVFTHSGAALHGQGFSLIVSNTAATNLPIGFPAAYSLQYRSNVTSWTVAASNYVVLPFIRTTNEVGGGIWLLGSVSELEADLEVASAGGNGFITKLTNAPGTVVTISNSYMPQAASMVLSNLAGVSQYFTNGQASSMVLSNLVGTVANNVTNESSTALQINSGTLALSPSILSNMVASGHGTPYISISTNGGTLDNITNLALRSGIVLSNDSAGIASLHVQPSSGSGSAVSNYAFTANAGFPAGEWRLFWPGDSWTAGGGTFTTNYVRALTNNYLSGWNFKGHTNGGVAGQKMSTAYDNWGNISSQMQGDTNELVFLLTGLNDLAVGTNAWQLINTCSNIATLVHSNGGHLMVFSLAPHLTINATVEAERNKYNTMLAKQSWWDYYCDLANAVPKPPNITYWQEDGAHGNDALNDWIAQCVSTVLQGGRGNPMPLQRWQEGRSPITGYVNYRGLQNALKLFASTVGFLMERSNAGVTNDAYSLVIPSSGGALFEHWHAGGGSFAAADLIRTITTGLTTFNAPVSVPTNGSIQQLTVTNGVAFNNATISGVGGANTNFTGLATHGVVYVDGGTTNVNFVAVMPGTAGLTYFPRYAISNLTATDREISFSSVTNFWRNKGQYTGITAPLTLTNKHTGWLELTLNGSNTWWTFTQSTNGF